LECFLDRLVHSEFAGNFSPIGGALLAALAFENTAEAVLSAVLTIAAISVEDGITFDSNGASAEQSARRTVTA
jgi:hypothetical protein